ncbi:MAG TPA: EAL domain-containing protein [Gaiellaceae bacterium]|nr:EAL domain-containing protein [Gaiellaceae bacterium]
MSLARPDRAFFLIAAASALAYLSLPRGSELYDRWYQLFPIAAVVAILAGVARNRPRSPVAWYLVAYSGLLGVLADAVYSVELERGGEVAFPSLADYVSLASSLVLAAGLVAMIRRQAPGRDWPSLVDAAIVAVGFALVAWALLVQPRIAGRGAVETVVALGFPVADVLLVSLAARMVLAAGLRSPPFAMVVVALVFQLVGDALYGFGSLHGWYQAGDPVDLLFVLSAILLGTAALHPSMVELTEPNTDPERRLSGKRLALLSAATLTAPAMLAVAALREGLGELLVIVGGATTLSALVTVRLAGLVARHERSERREHALAEAAAALAAAWTREDVHRVAAQAALRIVDRPGASAALVLESEGGPAIAAAAGARARELAELGPHRAADGCAVTAVPLAVQGTPHGTLVVHSPEELPPSTREGLETLAAQVALALEGAKLAEDLHERQSAERFRSLVQNSSDVILLLHSDLTVRYQTPSVERVLGYGEDELVGRSLLDLVEPDARRPLREFAAAVRESPTSPMPRDLPLRRKNGAVCQMESVFTNLLADPNVAGIVVTARDVTERRALEEQLAHQAFHDPLTGLANRALFLDRVGHALERGRRRRNLFAVLFVDLDDFKTVNDSLGHEAGDELLVEVARRLERSLRPEDTCARLGGDEFAILVENLTGPGAAQVVALRVLAAVSEPVSVLGAPVRVEASVGIALGTGAQSAGEIMRSADLAMYRAKGEGKGRFAVYEPALHERVLARLALKADLQRAALADEFELRYQPIVELRTGAVVAVEALLRWRHPERGLLGPDEFVAVAEETGVILPLGRFVLEAACREAARWRRLACPRLGVHVNISARQLMGAQLADEVAGALARSGLDPTALTLEITENALLESDVVLCRLAALKRDGVRVAIDDFGTGYSSLNYLRRLPVDTLKIAKAFVTDLAESREQQRLASAILRLGATLGLETVAEGVETPEQARALRTLGCRYAQGFLFARPLPAGEVDVLLRSARVA